MVRYYGKYLAIPPEGGGGDDLIINPSYTPTYYVANDGNDGNNGTSPETPWKTIAKVNSITLAAGNIVAFKCGDKWETESLNIIDNGASGNPITIGAYGSGIRPLIANLTNAPKTWVSHTGNIWKQPLASVPKQVIVNGSRIPVARNVKRTYSTITATSGTSTFTCNALNESIDYVGCTFSGRIDPYKFMTHTIVGQSGKTLTLDSTFAATGEALTVGNGFYLMNKLEFITEAGEWAWENGTMYIRMPDDSNPNNSNVSFTIQSTAISISSQSNITFRDLNISFAEVGIYAFSCDYITVDNCRVIDTDYAIMIYKTTSSHSTITNNHIANSNITGIKCSASNATIIDNAIYDTAMFNNLGLSGMGEYIDGRAMDLKGSFNIVRYNKIIRSGFLGIGVYKFVEGIIEYNYIQDVCLVVDDGGAIYMWEEDIQNLGCARTKIRKNIVSGATGTRVGLADLSQKVAGYGIYIDDRCKEITVEDNVVVTNGGASVFLHNNINSIVQRNIVLGGIRCFFVSGLGDDTEVKNNTFFTTKTAFNNTSQRTIEELNGNCNYSNNKYISHYDTMSFRKQGVSYTFSGWVTQKGTDTGSTIDVSTLPVGHSERMLYNETKVEKTFQLNGATSVKDVDGNSITADIVLQPFTGMIVTGINLELIA